MNLILLAGAASVGITLGVMTAGILIEIFLNISRYIQDLLEDLYILLTRKK